MTAKEAINTYDAWICKGDTTYVAVIFGAGKENALKIANSVFKVKKDKLGYGVGSMKRGYVYLSEFGSAKKTDGKAVWLVWVR